MANAIAWMIVGVLIGGAVLVTNHFGFVGLILLGALTWLICTRATMDQRVPVWSVEVFKAAMQRPRSPEERAAAAADHEASISPFQFYGWCGAFLVAVGVAGLLWQTWGRGS